MANDILNVPFSVLMSVYRNDKPEFIARAINSVTILQTLKPNEIVLVIDGPIPDELSMLIETFEKSHEFNFNIIRLPENKGLGNALRIGIEKASNEIVARMDSDDISLPDRFEKQIGYLKTHPECDVVGGQISEFVGEENNNVGHRNVPCKHEDIIMWLRGRCPFNHMSVAMLRSRILAVGNYIDWHFNEDYYLWIRMAQAGCKFANLPYTLVNVRVGADMYRRRGGWEYFRSEEGLQRYMLKYEMIGLLKYIYNVIGRFVIQVAMPNNVRGWVFQKLFRK